MAGLLASVGATIVALVLLVSGLGHARGLQELMDVLAAQGFRSRVGRNAIASTVSTLEISLALLAGAAILVQHGYRVESFLAISCLFGAYAVYAIWLIRQRPGVPCGCSSREHPVNIWVPIRAAVLCGCSIAAALAVGHVYRDSPFSESVVAAIAGIGLATILWSIPSAMARISTGVREA